MPGRYIPSADRYVTPVNFEEPLKVDLAESLPQDPSGDAARLALYVTQITMQKHFQRWCFPIAAYAEGVAAYADGVAEVIEKFREQH